MLAKKRIFNFALCLIFALTATSYLNANELTSNGDFESGNTSGWTSFETGAQTFGITTDASTGTFAGELFNPVTGTPLVVKQANLGIGVVVPGETVTISFDAKGEGVLGGVAFAEFFSELSGGGTSSSEILGGGPLSLTTSYQTFNFMTLAGSDVSGGVTLQFNAATGANIGSTSSLFVDNVSVSVFRAVPEPASTTLLVISGIGMLLRRRKHSC